MLIGAVEVPRRRYRGFSVWASGPGPAPDAKRAYCYLFGDPCIVAIVRSAESLLATVHCSRLTANGSSLTGRTRMQVALKFREKLEMSARS